MWINEITFDICHCIALKCCRIVQISIQICSIESKASQLFLWSQHLVGPQKRLKTNEVTAVASLMHAWWQASNRNTCPILIRFASFLLLYCISDINSFCITNKLTCNPSKTEVVHFSSRFSRSTSTADITFENHTFEFPHGLSLHKSLQVAQIAVHGQHLISATATKTFWTSLPRNSWENWIV